MNKFKINLTLFNFSRCDNYMRMLDPNIFSHNTSIKAARVEKLVSNLIDFLLKEVV